MTTTQTFPDPRDTYEGSPLIKETPPWEKDTYGDKNKSTLPIIENKEAAPFVPKKEQKAQAKQKLKKKHWGSDTESDSE